jgi:uncharacterized protein YaiL (DUF2058 family)
MRRILTSALLVVCLNGHAQTGQNAKNNADYSEFPKITFTWNDYEPETKEKSVFSVIDNDIIRKFDITHNQEKRNKSIFFLWEDMSANGAGPYDFTRETLLKFLRTANLQSGDKFGISVFSRERNNTDLLQPLVPGFTNNKFALINAVETYRHNTVSVSEQPKYSDLYKAIYKGIDMLKAEPADNVKAIVVFTVGWNLTGGGAKSDASELTNKALENHIPIYVALYPVHSTKTEIVTIAEDTYGKTIDYSDATNQLTNCYQTLNQRHSTHEYRFTFQTDTKKDGKLHNVTLLVNGKQQAQFAFSAPVFSIIDWAKENIWLAIGIIVGVISVILLTVILLIKKQKAKEARNRTEVQANLDRVQQEANAKAEEARREAERVKQQQLAYQQEQERKKQETEERAEQERLSNLMHIKNMYPRLQCVVGNNKFVYNMGQPIITVGRTDVNDLVLPHQTVSRTHAKIAFSGGGFEIVDLDSANKVIINGQFVKQATLKNGDIIGLGEAVITFYL